LAVQWPEAWQVEPSMRAPGVAQAIGHVGSIKRRRDHWYSKNAVQHSG
jgi:hypothetical protein